MMGADVASISRAGNQRPNIVGKPTANCDSSHLVGCIDVTAFAQPAAFTYGDAGRNILDWPEILEYGSFIVQVLSDPGADEI